FGLGVVEDVWRGDRRIPALGSGEPGALQDFGAVDAIAAALDDLWQDLEGLLHHFDPGLTDTAVIDRVRVGAFNLGHDRRVVDLLRVELVAAEDLDAALFGLLLERVGDADAIGTAVIEHIDRFDL